MFRPDLCVADAVVPCEDLDVDEAAGLLELLVILYSIQIYEVDEQYTARQESQAMAPHRRGAPTLDY